MCFVDKRKYSEGLLVHFTGYIHILAATVVPAGIDSALMRQRHARPLGSVSFQRKDMRTAFGNPHVRCIHI